MSLRRIHSLMIEDDRRAAEEGSVLTGFYHTLSQDHRDTSENKGCENVLSICDETFPGQAPQLKGKCT